MAVIKANAYGHGIVRIGKELEKLGADYLGVSNLYEALVLREANITIPILVLGYVDTQSIAAAIDNNVTISVTNEAVLNEIADQAQMAHKTVSIHVQLDTGMHLYGATPQLALELILRAHQQQYISVEGVYSHFADAEADDLSFAYKQLAVFEDLVGKIKQHGINPALVHMANGAAVVRMPEAHFDMVRVGTFLYGPQTGKQLQGFVPDQILSLKTKIVNVFDLQAGETIGYSQAFATTERKKIACIPIGYGHGFRQSPNWGYVLINGQRAPIIASVTMDKTAVDVTHITNVNIGDEVVLLGDQQQESIALNDIANHIHAANYEVLTGLTERVIRLYSK